MSGEHITPVSLKDTFQWMSPWIAAAIKPDVFEFHVLKRLSRMIWETKISLYIIVSMWSIWVYWGYLKNKNYSSRADFFFILSILGHFPSVSQHFRTRKQLSVRAFKGLFLPMALQNTITAGSDKQLTFCFGTQTRTQLCSGIKSCETPSGALPRLTKLAQKAAISSMIH